MQVFQWDEKKLKIALWLTGLKEGSAELVSQKLKEQGLEKIFYEIEIPLLEVLTEVEKLGIGVDQKKVSQLSDFYQKEIDIVKKEIHQLVGEEINLNSPKQISELLFNKLKIERKGGKRTKTGMQSTSFGVLEELRGAHVIVDLLLKYREYFKLISTYLEPWSKLSNRIHPTFLQTGTATGRLSCQNPNLQNVPPELRQVFVPAAGYKLVSFDYSQIELRVLATVAQDQQMISAFENNQDIHSLTASQVFHISLEEVTKEQRQLAKTLNFGMVYGMGVNAFAKSSGLSHIEAQKFITEYFANFARVRQWQEETKISLKEKGYVENLNGRRRWLLNIFAADPWVVAEAERAAINMPIQSLAADIMKVAMIKIHQQIKPRMILTIHDELLFEIENDKLKEDIYRIQKIMESAYQLSVPLKVEMAVGESWGSLVNWLRCKG